MARWRKTPVESITLYGIHGETAHGYPRTRGDDIAIAWGGVGAQILVLVVSLLLWPLIARAGSTFVIGALSPAYVVFTRLNIFVIVLMLFGGKKLPEFARGLGKSIREFKKAASGVEEDFKRALDEDEQRTIAAARPVTPALPPAAPTPA